jgi:hypothetical protein
MRRLTWAVSGFVLCVTLGLVPPDSAQAAKAPMKNKAAPAASSPVVAAQRYAEAVASGDRVTAGRLDFACQYGMVSSVAGSLKAFPPESDPVYARCWERLAKAHETAVEQRDQGVSELWPGKGTLVFFHEELTEYAPSFFVMDRLGLSPPAGGLKIEPINSTPLPAASFRVREGNRLVEAAASLVRLGVTYKDPLTSPVAYAPSEDHVTRKAKKARLALKGVTVKWVVLSGLRKLGFPGDVAVLNLPVTGADGALVPFVSERGGYLHDTRAWWGPADAPGVLTAAVGRAAQYPEQRDRLAMLTRVLLIDPARPDALTLLSRELYGMLLHAAAVAHKVPVGDAALAERFNELYWNAHAQSARTEIAEAMYLTGRAQPTPADYLYRMLPAMEKLARISPEDRENRLRLGIAYRWNNDQDAAAATHEILLKEIPKEQAPARVRAMLELAWTIITRVAWNRDYADPAIEVAYTQAEEAFKLTDRPLDKFTAAYTMAYSLAFAPRRDNTNMLELLTEARRWYQQVPGWTPESWRYLLQLDALKGVVAADPAFQSLLAGA